MGLKTVGTLPQRLLQQEAQKTPVASPHKSKLRQHFRCLGLRQPIVQCPVQVVADLRYLGSA
jgi:hypothetical protein